MISYIKSIEFKLMALKKECIIIYFDQKYANNSFYIIKTYCIQIAVQ